MPPFTEREFDLHWQRAATEPIPPAKKYAAFGFLKPLLDELAARPDMHILDAGCGDGVHLAVLAEHGGRQCEATGVDLSQAALDAAKARVAGDWRALRADVADMPLGEGTFDAAFAFGVLAYTEDPAHSFAELCRVVAPGGLIGVWFAPRRRGPLGWAFSAVRGLCRRLGPFLTRRVADLLVPILPLLPTRSKVSLANATWRQCREVVLVNIAPRTLHLLGEAEVERLFGSNGLSITWRDARNPITVWGRKPGAASGAPAASEPRVA